MNVLLVKPYSKSDHIQPSLGLAYLASSIRHKHNVFLLDMLRLDIRDSSFREYLKQKKYDVIGFQLYTVELEIVRKLLLIVRDISPTIITIVGGPHATVCPEETLKFFGDNVDFISIGEAERNFPLFLDKIENKDRNFSDVPGLGWQENNKININPTVSFENDLDKIGFPAWDLIRPQEYPPAQHGAFFKNFPIAPIITSRGCPIQCSFCSAPIISGKRIRKRSPDNVLEEIKLLYHNYGIREIHIVDDNFTLDKQHAISVLQKIYDSNLGISISFPNGLKVESLDEELLILMKKCGVYLISLGIESGSNRILKLMNKKLTVEKIKEKVELINKIGIDMAGFFILGFPSETKEEIEQTIKFSMQLPLIRANYFNFLPLPGTKIYHELLQNGELSHTDWSNFFFMTAPYAPQGITNKHLRSLQRKAFIKFYSRPRIFLKNICQIKSYSHFKYLLKRFYRWILS